MAGRDANSTTILQNTASLFQARDTVPATTNACRFLRVEISTQ